MTNTRKIPDAWSAIGLVLIVVVLILAGMLAAFGYGAAALLLLIPAGVLLLGVAGALALSRRAQRRGDVPHTLLDEDVPLGAASADDTPDHEDNIPTRTTTGVTNDRSS